jgi:hypothetical protein
MVVGLGLLVFAMRGIANLPFALVVATARLTFTDRADIGRGSEGGGSAIPPHRPLRLPMTAAYVQPQSAGAVPKYPRRSILGSERLRHPFGHGVFRRNPPRCLRGPR